MTTANLQQLTLDALVAHWAAYYRQLAPEDMLRLYAPMVRELAAGLPVAPRRLADLSGVPLERTLALLREAPTEWDHSGQLLVGFGLTSIPTPHHYETDGNPLWAWCAGESLLLPALIGASARIQSPCAATGDPITVEVSPDRVQRLQPADAVISTLTPATDLASTRRDSCSQQNFYRSAEAGASWLDEYPQGRLMPVAQAFEMARRVAVQLWGESPSQS